MTLTPGTRLGPYEILSPLGAGGMGEVFRARDTKLSRDVALKVLPDHLRDDPRALARFESEAHAVASLSHPHILAIHDFGRIDRTSFAVTELLEGETLRSLLLRGPLPARRALEIARPLADALAAAHARGIVHRDLKPENVFLTRDGLVKLLDFGLAHHTVPAPSPEDTRSPTAPVLTDAGSVLGTVAYMSPEQARGLPADHRSDQFSLGVLLYEMLSGRRPFHGDSAAETLTAIIREEPPPLEARVDGLPPDAAALVRRLLAKDPGDRFDSSRDLARDVSECWIRSASAPAGISAPASAPRGPVRNSRGIRRAATVAALAALATLAALAVVLVRRDPTPQAGAPSPPPASSSATDGLDPKRVVVAVFENRTGDPSFDPLGRMAAEWITQGIAGLRINIVPSADVFDAPLAENVDGRPIGRETVRALADRTRAGIVVSGAYYLSGGDLRIQAQVSEVATGRLLHALEPSMAPRSDPMAAIDAARRQVRDAIAVKVGDEVDGFLEGEERPPKYEAYTEYLLGEERFGIDYDAAEAHYRRALEIDPDFVMARIVLMSALRNRSRWEEAAAEMAVLERRKSGLSRYYRAIFDALKEIMAGRTEERYARVREFARLAPGDVLSQFDVAYNALIANRPGEAEAACRAPAAWDLFLTPSRAWGAEWFRVLGASLHVLGRHEEELATTRKGLGVYPARPELLRAEVRALVALGRDGEVDRLVEKGLDRAGAGELPESLLLEAAAELAGHGRPDDARRMAGRAADRLFGKPGKKLRREEREALARALLAAERWREALPVLAALETGRAGEDVAWTGLRAVAAHRSGDDALAARLDEALRRLDRPYLFGKHTFARAGLAAHRGEKEKAVELLRQALAQGYFREEAGASFFAHRSLELAPLLGYPPFEELVKPKG